jgi:hypothetical protein
MPIFDSERRGAKRIAYPCEVRGFALGADLLNAHVSNLSASGALLEMSFDLPEGTIVLLKFRVADVDVKVEGEVVRDVPPNGMAVRFLNLKPEHRRAIERVTAD